MKKYLAEMVGTHGDGDATVLLQFKEGFHHVVHVHVSFQVVGFVEVAFGVALRTAQMDKVDAVGKFVIVSRYRKLWHRKARE